MAGTSTLLGALPLALLGGTTARVRDLGDWDRAIRGPVATSRRLSFVQLRGGAGASTTATQVAATLASRRRGRVLGVDASGGNRGLAQRSGAPADAIVTPASDRRRTARSTADAVDGLFRPGSGLGVLGLAAHEPGAVPGANRWLLDAAPIVRFFDAVCTDWGVRGWQLDLADVTALSDTVCLVARADRRFAEEALALAQAIEDSADHPRVVLALVDVGDTAGLAPATVARTASVYVSTIPFDRGHATGAPLATRTRLAYTRLAAELMQPAGRPAVPLQRSVRTGRSGS